MRSAVMPPRSAVDPAKAEIGHHLTVELLDWLIGSLVAVASTPEMAGYPHQLRILLDALKKADMLYPAARRHDEATTPRGDAGGAGARAADEDELEAYWTRKPNRDRAPRSELWRRQGEEDR